MLWRSDIALAVGMPKDQSKLVKEIVPAQITISGIQRVLQILLAEHISIRDLATVLESIAEGLPATRNPASLAEHVRAPVAPALRPPAPPVICRSSH